MALDPPCPKFQVLAGPSAEELSPVNVNADKTDPFRIHTDLFQGTYLHTHFIFNMGY
jgi:hypothetical protein